MKVACQWVWHKQQAREIALAVDLHLLGFLPSKGSVLEEWVEVPVEPYSADST